MKSHSVDISCVAEIINYDALKSIGINEVAADKVLQLFFWEFPDGWSTAERYEDGPRVYIVDENG